MKFQPEPQVMLAAFFSGLAEPVLGPAPERMIFYSIAPPRLRVSVPSCVQSLGLVVFLAAVAASNAATGPEGTRLHFDFKRGHIILPAQVDGSNSVWFMLDTGFSITVVDPRLAELLKLRRMGQTTIVGIAGEERADLFAGPAFDFAGARYAPRRVAALPSDNHKRSRRLEGILGAGFLRRFVVEIDPHAQTITLHEPKDYHYTGPGEVVPLKLRNSTPVVEAAINLPGRPPVRGQFEIDTGCDGGLCLGHDFVEANGLQEAGGPTQGGSRSGIGGDAQINVGSVPQLQLGRLTVDKPEANFFQQGSPVEGGYAGHIGMGVLRQFRIIFDYSREQLMLEPPSASGEKKKSG